MAHGPDKLLLAFFVARPVRFAHSAGMHGNVNDVGMWWPNEEGFHLFEHAFLCAQRPRFCASPMVSSPNTTRGYGDCLGG